jgi:hypothetical protein
MIDCFLIGVDAPGRTADSIVFWPGTYSIADTPGVTGFSGYGLEAGRKRNHEIEDLRYQHFLQEMKKIKISNNKLVRFFPKRHYAH